ncbi:MAG: PilC/PilY family type IV pilus protein [Gammaproteobacteria bacterium]
MRGLSVLVLSAAMAVPMAISALLASNVARADDSELFLSDAAANAVRANVLFLIDTSGSMDTLVNTQATFDTGQTFSGCYDSDALYFTTNGAIPACDSLQVLPKTINRCATSQMPLQRVGYYADFLLSWDPTRERWDSLTPDRADTDLECQNDRGIDGNGATSELFAANGSTGPWNTSSANEPAWNTRYTIYDGNWLNWRSNPPTVQKSRIEIVKEAVAAVTAGLQNVNIGVMRFNGDEGGSVIAALDNIQTSRDSVTTIVNALTTGGRTPLSEAMYEAGQYFAGRDVDYGNGGTIPSVAASRVGNTLSSPVYRSPITENCSKNFIILLTDGEPVNDNSADSKITSLPDFGTLIGGSCDGSGDGHCLDDMAAYLLRQDLSSTLPGMQNVVTHAIGFAADFPLLVATAARGGGEYHLADDTASLSTALSGIVLSIFDNVGTFAAPAVPVNAFNRSENLSDVFLSVFQPTDTARWQGNLKKYRLQDGVLVGQDGRAVVDSATGLFARDAHSFWSVMPDGDRVSAGGAASRLPMPSSRQIYTNLANGDLSSAANRVRPGTPGLSDTLTAVPVAERDAVINWALGYDVRDVDQDGDTAEARHDMGDALHVQPLTLLYSGTATNAVSTVFLATNDGYLHAIDATSGEELWAFIPTRLLNQLYKLYRNEAASTKTYGLDGEINLVIRNDDGLPGLSGNEQAILLFGMGRGGDGVFAVDVTARNAPRLLWEINSSNPDFADLGQTWSTPNAARVNIGGTVRSVAVFGGGYDPGQDNRSFRQDTQGNAIYLVDLQTGQRLWSVGSDQAVGPHDLTMPALRYSIPAPVRPLDLDGDGLAERFYVGDMGGQLWRFDIVNGESGSSLVEGGVLASLGGAALATPTTADLRRFYEAPDVTPVIIDRKLLLSINIGSGYQGHPLDSEIEEAFYSIRDFKIFGVIDSNDYPTSPVSVGQLVDITDDAEAEVPFATAGWQLRLVQGNGEKILGESLTFDNVTFFTSFTPGEAAGECTGGTGVNRLYAISVVNGRPRTNFDSPVGEPLTVLDRARVLDTGIPVPSVSLIRLGTDGPPEVCAGINCLTAAEKEGLNLRRSVVRRTYWFPREGP